MPNTNLIVKNTIALYARSFISLILSLLTARLVLANLGIEDYGVYNAVGGVVSMVAFIQGSLAGATQRFLSFYIGLGNKKQLKEVFSMCINVHLIISTILIFAIEIFGCWYLSNKLDYGTVNFSVVKLIFHTSVASLFFIFNSIPFNSMLIAKESMQSFAYIDILQKLLMFCLAYSLSWVALPNRLSLYAISVMLISITVFSVYILVCRKKFEESHYVFFWDSKQFKELFAFTGWITLPALVSILKTQGMIVALNSAFGPVLNAAQSISNQVNNAVKSLANNVGAAFSPQITITYAQKDYTSMTKLFVYGSKITFFLFAYMFIPLCVEMDFVLKIWLKEVPMYTSTIVKLIMTDTLISSMTSCFNVAIRSTGNIKFYEVTYNLFHLLGLILVFILIRLGCEYYVPYVILAVFSLLSISIQLYCMKRVLPFVSIRSIIYSMLQMVTVVLFSFALIYMIASGNWSNEWGKFLSVIFLSTIIMTIMIYGIGLSKEEKRRLIMLLKDKIIKHK